MNAAAEIHVELRRHEDDSHTGIVTYSQYQSLPSQVAAENTPYLFVRGHDGRRIELGSLTQLCRTLGLGQDYSQRRRAG